MASILEETLLTFASTACRSLGRERQPWICSSRDNCGITTVSLRTYSLYPEKRKSKMQTNLESLHKDVVETVVSVCSGQRHALVYQKRGVSPSTIERTCIRHLHLGLLPKEVALSIDDGLQVC